MYNNIILESKIALCFCSFFAREGKPKLDKICVRGSKWSVFSFKPNTKWIYNMKRKRPGKTTKEGPNQIYLTYLTGLYTTSKYLRNQIILLVSFMQIYFSTTTARLGQKWCCD